MIDEQQTDAERRYWRIVEISAAALKHKTGLTASKFGKAAGLSVNALGNFTRAQGARDLEFATQQKLMRAIGYPLSVMTLEMGDAEFHKLLEDFPPRLVGESPDNVKAELDSLEESGHIHPLASRKTGGNEVRRGRNAPDIRPILEIDVRAGMGGGGIAVALNHTDEHGNTFSVDEVRAEWGIPPDYLKHELRVPASEARIIEVQGNSMEPLLFSGDRVMVNTADQRPSPSGVFALWDGMAVVVKEVQYIMKTDPPMIRIISKNPDYTPEEHPLDDVNIIGRVVWFARRM